MPCVETPSGLKTYPNRPHQVFDVPVIVPVKRWPTDPVNVRDARWKMLCVIVAGVPLVGMDWKPSGSTLYSGIGLVPVYASARFTRQDPWHGVGAPPAPRTQLF